MDIHGAKLTNNNNKKVSKYHQIGLTSPLYGFSFTKINKEERKSKKKGRITQT